MSIWVCDKETASCLIIQQKQIQRQYVVSSQNLYSLLCIIHSCAHKMSDYIIRIFLPLEKTLNSFIRVKRIINKNVGTLFGSWESPGSVFGCYCESPGYLPGVPWVFPGSCVPPGCLLDILINILLSKQVVKTPLQLTVSLSEKLCNLQQVTITKIPAVLLQFDLTPSLQQLILIWRQC